MPVARRHAVKPHRENIDNEYKNATTLFETLLDSLYAVKMPIAGKLADLYLAIEFQSGENIHKKLDLAQALRCDFIALPLGISREFEATVDPNNTCSQTEAKEGPHERQVLSKEIHWPFVASAADLLFSSNTWNASIVAVVPSFIQPDHPNPIISSYYCDAFAEHLQWSFHLNTNAILTPTPLYPPLHYTRLLKYQSATLPQTPNIWVRIPIWRSGLNNPPQTSIDGSTDPSIDPSTDPSTDGWILWNMLRTLGDYPRLSVALELTDLPDSYDILDRWFAEPVRAIIIPTHLFISNAKGYPVLSVRHKLLLQQFFKYNVRIIIKEDATNKLKPVNLIHLLGDAEAHSDGHSVAFDAYANYIARLFKALPPASTTEAFEYPYRDCLQIPLQPLQDNLESQTYETFEKDAQKYTLYEEAIYQRLLDISVAEANNHPSKDAAPHVILYIVGAGRGPLVNAALLALQRAHITDYRVTAIEKNKHAVRTLHHRVQWDNNPLWRHVHVLQGDMRDIDVQEEAFKADILISELLGSFGDNELSPECLEGMQRYLKPDGISIPLQYTSYVEPISTPTLWASLRQMTSFYESIYVVKFHAYYKIASSGPKACFTFQHKNDNSTTPANNSTTAVKAAIHLTPKNPQLDKHRRYTTLSFTAKTDAVIHGFAGYFECVLYKHIKLSTVPEQANPNMFSWFPVYIPLKEPVYATRKDAITLHIWRCTDEKKVWYEWCLSTPLPTAIHNTAGRSSNMQR